MNRWTTMLLAASLLAAACDDGVTEAHVKNDAAPLTVVKVWYRSTLFVDPVAPGETSASLRVATGTEPVYALVRSEGGALVAARSRDLVSTTAGDEKEIVVSPATMRIGCGSGDGMSPEDRDFIATRIFPGDAVAPCAPR